MLHPCKLNSFQKRCAQALDVINPIFQVLMQDMVRLVEIGSSRRRLREQKSFFSRIDPLVGVTSSIIVSKYRAVSSRGGSWGNFECIEMNLSIYYRKSIMAYERVIPIEACRDYRANYYGKCLRERLLGFHALSIRVNRCVCFRY
jgi:hypothetical protein